MRLLLFLLVRSLHLPLISEFEKSHYPDVYSRDRLAALICVPEPRVQVCPITHKTLQARLGKFRKHTDVRHEKKQMVRLRELAPMQLYNAISEKKGSRNLIAPACRSGSPTGGPSGGARRRSRPPPSILPQQPPTIITQPHPQPPRKRITIKSDNSSPLFSPSDGATLQASLAACRHGGAVDAENGSEKEDLTRNVQKSGRSKF